MISRLRDNRLRGTKSSRYNLRLKTTTTAATVHRAAPQRQQLPIADSNSTTTTSTCCRLSFCDCKNGSSSSSTQVGNWQSAPTDFDRPTDRKWQQQSSSVAAFIIGFTFFTLLHYRHMVISWQWHSCTITTFAATTTSTKCQVTHSVSAWIMASVQ